MADDTLQDDVAIVKEESKECFVIMPISDPEGYAKGHFERVYKDIFVPAIEKAGFIARRADEDRSSNLIQLEMLKKIIKCPIALCDLSTRNPNVLFELGIRQAFDMPVVLVQEFNTPQIFDITGLRYFEYHRERLYHEVLEDQIIISDAIKKTHESSKQVNVVNSLIRLLSIRPAEFIDLKDMKTDPNIELILHEISILKKGQKLLINTVQPITVTSDDSTFEKTLLYSDKVKDALQHYHNLSHKIDNGEVDAQLMNKLLSSINNYNTLYADTSHIQFKQLAEGFSNLLFKAEAIANQPAVG